MTTGTSRDAGVTGLMRQYLDVKAKHPDAILFFRLGDFYEMFYEDATYVSQTLSLTLTTRDKGKDDPVPMCGVPHHAARAYVAKLTELGHRVAICEQLEDPRTTKGIVKRGVVRIVTPGVILDEESLDPRAPNYLAAVAGDARSGFGLAFVDVTTGDFRATEAPSTEALLDELARAEPRELLVPRGERELAATLKRAYPRLAHTPISIDDEPPALETLSELLSGRPDGAALDKAPAAALAAARVLRYARATQVSAPLAITRLELFVRSDYLIIDEQARAHLELTETMLDRRRVGSLLDVLDVTATAMGGRLLRRWMLFPLMDIARIRRRQDAIERLVAMQSARDGARKVLSAFGDLERLSSRARLGVATPRDVVALGRSLAQVPALCQALRQASELAVTSGAEDDLLTIGAAGMELAATLSKRIADTLLDDAPALTKEGGFIRPGVSAELDELTAIASGGRDRVAAIEARERERTGIASLKVKYNNVFGYYIEITRSQLANVPSDYLRKQTVANAERFVTPELSEYEAKIASADERRISLENALFTALREEVGRSAEGLFALATQVATVDVVAALAEQAHRHGYVRPVVDDSDVIDLVDARHPVVERLAAAGGFVPNDVRLDVDNEQLILVTGPNMAGKSTLIRQVATAVVMAQMGSFVPASQARLGLVDRLFTRVGAGDNLARGESTFLVEMRETAHILRHATRKSLVVLDEIGRGTSTYDGVSIAWAVAEHLHDRLGAKTLFATHYHELCALAESHPRVRNVSVAAREWKGDVVFLRKLVAGGASRSFGIEVGKLAGLPDEVVNRARAILETLEGDRAAGEGPNPVAPGRDQAPQLGLFNQPKRPSQKRTQREVAPATTDDTAAQATAQSVVDAIAATDLDELSPRAAWDLLADLRKKLTTARSRERS